jgi:hypothetical protein
VNEPSKRNEPSFLLEMPHAMRMLVMKRGHLLRSQRTRTLMCVGKGGQKSWLEASLILGGACGDTKEWDEAHSLAKKCKRELHCDIYVEPAQAEGRFKYLTTPEGATDWSDPADFMSPGTDGGHFGFGAGLSMGAGGFDASDPFGGFGPGGHGRSQRGGVDMFSSFGMDSSLSKPNIPGMPHIPDPLKDLLPLQVREAMRMKSDKEKKKAKKPAPEFPALRKLPSFAELPESLRMMFEAEARQLEPVMTQAGGLLPQLPDASMTSQLLGPAADERFLAVLSVNPKISATLKKFLLEQFELITD